MIILSAGHHPKAKGATFRDYSEYPYTMNWCKKIRDHILSLDDAYCTLIKTGTLDKKVREVNRVVKNAGTKCLAVELHFNSDPSGKGRGNETLYYPGSVKGKYIASIYNDHFVMTCPIIGKNRGIKEGWYKMDRPGIIDYYGDVDGDEMPDYWLKATSCPALILEPCFIQNLEYMVANEDMVCKCIGNSLVHTFNIVNNTGAY